MNVRKVALASSMIFTLLLTGACSSESTSATSSADSPSPAYNTALKLVDGEIKLKDPVSKMVVYEPPSISAIRLILNQSQFSDFLTQSGARQYIQEDGAGKFINISKTTARSMVGSELIRQLDELIRQKPQDHLIIYAAGLDDGQHT